MRKRGVIGSPLNLFSLSSEYFVRVAPRLKMRLGVCNLRRTAHCTAPTRLFNSVWWIARPRTDSALKTPHTNPPCHPFVGVSSVIFPILFFSLPLYGEATHHLAELPDVCFGSKADIAERETNVRFTPKSGHQKLPRITFGVMAPAQSCPRLGRMRTR